MFHVILKLQGMNLTQSYKEYNDNVTLKTSRRNTARDFEFFFFFFSNNSKKLRRF